jgi:hypothetical protein
MLRRLQSIAASTLFLLAVSAKGQTVGADSTASRLLHTQIPAMSLSQVTIPEAAARVLFRVDIPAGIVVSRSCQIVPLFNFEIPSTTVAEALNMIVSSDNTYRWSLESGVVHIFPVAGIPSLLETIVPLIDSTQHPQSVGAMTSAILNSPEMKRKIAQLNLAPAMMTIVKGINVNPKMISLVMHDSSLLQVLDAFAATNGRAVWEYDEFCYQNSRQYQFSWRKD